MCDIFALSSGGNYTAQQYLPVFAEKARQNMSGWGIGFFRDNQAPVENINDKSCCGIADQQIAALACLAEICEHRRERSTKQSY